MRRSTLVLLAGCAIAGTAAYVGGDVSHPTPAAAMDGDAIDPVEVSKFQNLETGSSTAKKPATLDSIDLDKITRDGDHYTAPLADGRIATLTLDPALQELAEKLLNESRAPKGAIVVMTPEGKILALAGRKTEEPKGSRTGTFDWRLATDVWAPAASIFKLVTASALVKAGVDPDAKVCYHGGIRSVLQHNLQDDKRDNRCESLSYGVAHSQNAILGKLAFQKLEPTKLEDEAKAFGWIDPLANLKGMFGELDIPKEKDLELARTAAGFKGARLSVMGGALLTATFANAGEQPMPRLIASIDGKAVDALPAKRIITAEQAKSVARMMAGTCEGGSAAKTFNRKRKVTVAGKTGTLTRSDPFYMEHSWFVGFAPTDKPQLVVSVLLGNPESWHLRGHEAARRLIDKFFAPGRS
ncbi:MAG: penicillin-binding transpeptidase domain-containing protein [Myxococcota bacterium]|nr:penicillin-binding transpeptidase domain-containing protein [Myxococcota bacterium]